MTQDLSYVGIYIYTDSDFLGCLQQKISLAQLVLNSDGVTVNVWKYTNSMELQSLIKNSAIHTGVEYITLSQGTRELVSARSLMFESKVWEENTGAQNLTTVKGPLFHPVPSILELNTTRSK